MIYNMVYVSDSLSRLQDRQKNFSKKSSDIVSKQTSQQSEKETKWLYIAYSDQKRRRALGLSMSGRDFKLLIKASILSLSSDIVPPIE